MPAGGLTLYAIWFDQTPINNVRIVYDQNIEGKSGTETGMSWPQDSAFTVEDAPQAFKTAADGMDFICWNTQSDGFGANYFPGETYTMPAGTTLTLYAVWDHMFDVVYDANGASGTAPDSMRIRKGEEFTIPSGRKLQRPADKVFKEWNTEPDGTGDGYAVGSKYTMEAESVTFYAIWGEHMIVYRDTSGNPIAVDNGGSNGGSDSWTYVGEYTTYYSEGKSVVYGVPPSSLGSTFVGWNTKPDGTGETYAPGSLSDYSGDLYAIWSGTDAAENAIPVIPPSPAAAIMRFDLNGGSTQKPETYRNKVAYEGTAVALPLANHIRPPADKRFLKWNEKPDGTGASYDEGETIFMPGTSTTLYAIYENIPGIALELYAETSDGVRVTVTLKPSDTVSALKQAISLGTGVSAAGLTAAYKGVVLKDSNLLYDYDIPDKAVIDLVVDDAYESLSVLYVGKSGQWNGKSPVYTDPQDAIDTAAWISERRGTDVSVLVAVGTYVPARMGTGGVSNDTTAHHFALRKGVTVIGGFAGNENGIIPAYDQSEETADDKKTIFSGENNSKNVVKSVGDIASGTLKNVVITGGKGDVTSATSGGGLYIEKSNPMLINCTLKGNTSKDGGGLYILRGSPVLINCYFIENGEFSADQAAGNSGGGAYIGAYSAAKLINCVFRDNKARLGGGLSIGGSGNTTAIINCTIENNEALDCGGGMQTNLSSTPIIVNCVFSGNVINSDEPGKGGGLYINRASPKINNCVFVGNKVNGTNGQGGGIYDNNSNATGFATTLTNCTIIRNTAEEGGGGIYRKNDTVLNIYNSIVALNTSTNGDNNVGNGAGNNNYLKFKNSVVGNTPYANDGTTTTTIAVEDSHFDEDGKLDSGATYAIGAGDKTLFDDSLTAISTVLGTSVPAANVVDMDGNLIIYETNKIDMGAFGGGTPAVTPALPAPAVTAVSDAGVYASSSPVNSSVRFSAVLGDLSGLDSYPFLPTVFIADYYKNAKLYYTVDVGSETEYTLPITASASGNYIFTSRLDGVTGTAAAYTVNINSAKPVVTAVAEASGNMMDAPKSGSIIITFDTPMLHAGAVMLEEDYLLSGGVWDVESKVYTVNYANLPGGTEYRISISGFREMNGGKMEINTVYRLKTKSEPPTLSSYGVDTLALVYGYTEVSIPVELGGAPLPATVSVAVNPAGGSIAWNHADKTLEIGAGLGIGDYAITLTAQNAVSPDASLDIALTILPADANSLAALIQVAEQIQSGAVVGTEDGEYPQAAYDAFGTAINEAKAAAVKAVRTLVDVQTAAGNLETAINTFLDAVIRPARNSGGGFYTPPTTTEPANTAGGTVSLDFTLSGGTVTIDMPVSKVAEIIDKAVGGTASIDLSGAEGSTSAQMPKEALSQIAQAGLDVEIKLPQGTVTLDADALASAAEQASGGDITVSLNEIEHTALTPEQQTAVGQNDLVFDISVMSGESAIHNFDGTITVTVPYSGELPAAVWYLNDNGELEKLVCAYDAKTGTVTFTTEHLSLYVLGKDPAPDTPFIDVTGYDWFYDDVLFVYENGLMKGTHETLFSPAAQLTRAMLVTILYRHAGSPSVSGLENPFSDVESGTWYTDAVIWAADKKIVSGYGYGIFGHGDSITRQDAALVLQNYANISAIDLTAKREDPVFDDDAYISDYAKTAVYALYRAEIIEGRTGNIFDPGGYQTRSETAALLHRFLG